MSNRVAVKAGTQMDAKKTALRSCAEHWAVLSAKLGS